MGMKGVISRDESPAGVIGFRLPKEGKSPATPALDFYHWQREKTSSEIRKSTLCLHLMQRESTRTAMA